MNIKNKLGRAAGVAVASAAIGGLGLTGVASASTAQPAAVTSVATHAIPSHQGNRSGDEAQALSQAACAEWELAGTDIYQNNGWTVRFHSGLNGFKGRVESWSWKDPGKSIWGTLVNGSVRGNVVQLSVDWDNRAFGVYEGQIDANGYVFGSTYDRFNPSSTATWRTGQQALCVKR